jgi:hypothetical protein
MHSVLLAVTGNRYIQSTLSCRTRTAIAELTVSLLLVMLAVLTQWSSSCSINIKRVQVCAFSSSV